MKRNICVLTQPRTGSELLMGCLAKGLGLESIGEFLTQSQPFKKIVDNGISDKFAETYTFRDEDINKAPLSQYRVLAGLDFDRRLRLIKRYNKPVIVKTFTANPFFKCHLDRFEYLTEQMDVIVLTREDKFKSILSAFICEHIRTWHVTNEEDYRSVKERVADVRFEVPEDLFVKLVIDHNLLTMFYKNADKYSNVSRILYEDFADDPVRKLNERFSMNLESLPTPIKGFIDNHESHIVNLDRLRQLYRMYSVE